MLQESLSQFIQFELWFSLIEALISRYWLSKAPRCAEGIGASALPISTPGFEMIKRVSYLSQEWEVRGWMMSEMQTHSHLNTAWDAENERQRGTWMKEEASHHGVVWNRVGDWEREEDRTRGEVFMREKGKKRVIIWGIFVRRRRWLPTHVWTLFWQQCLRQKQSWWDLWAVLV